MAQSIAALSEALLVAIANYASKSKAAEELAARARAGEDIEAALPALEATLEKGSQVGLLDVAADAMAYHLLRRREPERMVEIAGRLQWGSYLWRALERIAGDDIPLDPLLHCLREGDGIQGYTRDSTIMKWLEQSPERTIEVSDRLRAEDPGLFLRVFSELADAPAPEDGANPTLEHLATLLESTSGKLLERAVAVARSAARAGRELGPIRPVLQALARRRSSFAADHALLALVMDAGHRQDWGEVDRRLASRSPGRRRLAYQALRALGSEDPGSDPELLRRLAAGLAERDPQIHDPALVQLRKAARAGRDVRAPGAVLAKLGRLLSDHPAHASAQEYLFEAGVATARPPCPICLELGRETSWGMRGNKPPGAVGELKSHGDWRACPRCPNTYSYSRYHEDRGLYPEWEDTLRRLSPRQAAEELSGRLRATAVAALESRLAQAREDLAHPMAQLRAEAAWVLADDAATRRDAEALAALARSRDGEVVAEVLETMDRMPPESPAPDLGDAVLAPLSSHEDARIRKAAGSLRMRGALREGSPERVLEALAMTAPDALRSAGVVLLRSTTDGASLAPFAARLGELTAHPNDSVRRIMAQVLRRAPDDPGLVAVRTERALERLASSDPELWEDGAEELARLGEEGHDVAAHLPLLVPGLSDPARAWRANQAYARLLGSPLGEAALALRPRFFEALGARHKEKMGSFEAVLAAFHRRGDHCPEYLEDIIRALRNRNNNVPTMAFQLLELASETSNDLAPFRARLLRTAPGLEGYMTERIGRFLGRIDRAARDFDALAELLAHENGDIRYGAMMAIEEGYNQKEPLGALIEPLVGLLGERSQVHRERAAHHLRKLVGKRKKDRARLARALEGAPEGEEAEKLRAWLET